MLSKAGNETLDKYGHNFLSCACCIQGGALNIITHFYFFKCFNHTSLKKSAEPEQVKQIKLLVGFWLFLNFALLTLHAVSTHITV